MYRLFLDTNFLLDCMNEERRRYAAATKLAGILQLRSFRAAMSPHSLADINYISRDLGKELRYEFISTFLSLYDVVPLDAIAYSEALSSHEPDYEDSLIRACAESWEADYIISADRNAYKDSLIPSIEAADFLEMLGTAH